MRAAQPSEFPGKWRLWVHCPGLLESHLHEYFSQFGAVIDLYIPRDRHNGARKSYGFVTFETEDGLKQTLAAGSEHRINGRTVRINLAGPRPEQQQQPPLIQGGTVPLGEAVPGMQPWQAAGWQATSVMPHFGGQPEGVSNVGESSGADKGRGPRIYVGGIPTAVSETMVRNHFSQWGQVADVYFPKDRALNRRKNFCFVTFATQQAAEKAAAQSNREISGYRIESISLTQERHTHYVRKQGMGGPAMGTAQEGLPDFEYAEDSGQQWAGTPGTGFTGAFQGLSGHLGGGMPGFAMLKSLPQLQRCLEQGGGAMQQGGLAMQPGWGALEAQQALLQGGQPMGMGLAQASLGEGTMMQARQGYAHVDPSMAYTYGPDLGMSSRIGARPQYGEGLAAPQAAFQQSGWGLQGPMDVSGYEPGGQQPGTAYQSGRQSHADP